MSSSSFYTSLPHNFFFFLFIRLFLLIACVPFVSVLSFLVTLWWWQCCCFRFSFFSARIVSRESVQLRGVRLQCCLQIEDIARRIQVLCGAVKDRKYIISLKPSAVDSSRFHTNLQVSCVSTGNLEGMLCCLSISQLTDKTQKVTANMFLKESVAFFFCFFLFKCIKFLLPPPLL